MFSPFPSPAARSAFAHACLEMAERVWSSLVWGSQGAVAFPPAPSEVGAQRARARH